MQREKLQLRKSRKYPDTSQDLLIFTSGGQVSKTTRNCPQELLGSLQKSWNLIIAASPEEQSHHRINPHPWIKEQEQMEQLKNLLSQQNKYIFF